MKFFNKKIFKSSFISSSPSTLYKEKIIVSFDCAIVCALVFGISGMIIGSLASEGFIAIPGLGPTVRKGILFCVFFTSTISAFLGAFLGAIAGILSFLINKEFWDEDSF